MTEIATTFHFPCHTCGQPVEVVDTVKQPHECRTYETETERICAAYWAGFDRANLPTGVNGGQGSYLCPDGADDAPDEPKESQATSPGHDAPAPVGSQYRVVEVEQEFRTLDAAKRAGAARALRDLADDIDPNGFGWASPSHAERFKRRIHERANRIEATR